MKSIFLTLTLLVIINGLQAQKVAEQRIDSMFSEWSDGSKPGGAAAFIYDNELVYAKGFGKSNLKSGEANGSNTSFEVAALSQHFTSFAILMLADQGKISFSDDIRKYLPQLPAYNEVVTVNHLLSHSSGLYDIEALRNLLGWDENDLFTMADALSLLSQQRALNFSPGTAFSYSETNSVLLSALVEKVSGNTLKEYLEVNVFEPAGMANTWFHEDSGLLPPNAAVAYRSDDNGVRQVRRSFNVVGAGNLYSSVSDLAKWEMNLMKPVVGNKAIIDKLNSIVTLTNGKEFSTTQGNLTYGQQFYHKERGITELYRTGALDGYTSAIFKFAHAGFAAIVLSNDGSYYRGYLGMETAYLFLEETFPEPATTDFNKIKTKPMAPEKMKALAGSYWDDGRGVSRQILYENDSLYYSIRPGDKSPLIHLGNGRFQMKVMWDDKIYFTFKNTNSGMGMEYVSGDSDPFVFTRYTPVEYTVADLKLFEGSYYNEVYNLGYRVEVKDGKLFLSNVLTGDHELISARENHFRSSTWFARSLTFDVDNRNRVNGFNMSFQGIRDLKFKKVS